MSRVKSRIVRIYEITVEGVEMVEMVEMVEGVEMVEVVEKGEVSQLAKLSQLSKPFQFVYSTRTLFLQSMISIFTTGTFSQRMVSRPK